ncbi:hypothetical protein AVEN_89431-1 [Araneus ventricosus]|uniref:Uncharacterized protein n=1 Tax=Araneus ventricosus TaxID=182803 RepID=A0A4Y2PJP7_ARAVE|nr:hypothetical protein AVEN_89431-1 [Araneus ventricosus]
MHANFQWHFTATSHGKGAIDGLGDTIKRRVEEATCSRNTDPQTAEEFVDCTKRGYAPKLRFCASRRKLLQRKTRRNMDAE